MSLREEARQLSKKTGRSVQACRSALRRGRPVRPLILRATREWLQQLKARPCADCGREFHPVCMDFHHLDPAQKSFNIGMALGKPQVAVLQEVAKCVIICANCHRLRTWAGGPDLL